MMRKNHYVFPFVCLVLILMLLSGCLEYKVVTQVMEDGSIRRTVVIRGDSSLIYEQAFPHYDDPTWEITTRYEPQDVNNPGGDEVFVLEATKSFPDVHSLNEDIYSDDPYTDQMNIKAAFKKQFKWFCSLYDYSETYLMRFPFRSQPIHDFMTLSELRVYNAEDDQVYYDPERDSLDLASDDMELPALGPADSLRSAELKARIESKYEEWVKGNLFDAFYAELENGFAALQFVPGNNRQKEDLYQWLDSSMVFEEIFDEKNALIEAAADFYNLDSAQLHSANREGFDAFNRKTEGLEVDLDSFTHQVLMPGMVMQSNAGETDGNLVTWNFTTNDFYASDYTMTVQSRVINRWMVVVSSVVVFLVVGMVIVLLVVKRKK